MGELKFRRLLAIAVSFIFLGIAFQNCSGDDFGTNGNGQPYEGLSIDGFTERPPLEEDNDPPADDFNGSQNANNGIVDNYFICSNDQSTLIDRVNIGMNGNGSEVIIALKPDDNGYSRPWLGVDQSWYSFNREMNANLTFDGISLHMDFPNVLQIVLRYSSSAGREDFTEVMDCTQN